MLFSGEPIGLSRIGGNAPRRVKRSEKKSAIAVRPPSAQDNRLFKIRCKIKDYGGKFVRLADNFSDRIFYFKRTP